MIQCLRRHFFVGLLFIQALFGFQSVVFSGDFKTENVIIVIMDGPRYSETWGDSTHQNIPHIANDLVPQGVFYERFRNNGPTYTNAGHTAVCTGKYEHISNDGKELPTHPSIFQYWLKHTGAVASKAYIIASKDKLAILTNCKKRKWNDTYRPSQNCGKDGLFSGHRLDAQTIVEVNRILETDKPNLVLVNFRQPDAWGHANNYEKYIAGMKKTDEYIHDIFKFIQTNEHYKGKTAMFVTNDHGRHLDGHKDGFVSHGDNCEGCRRMICYAYGPDFKRDVIFQEERELIDIPVTVAHILGFPFTQSKGQVMTELFK